MESKLRIAILGAGKMARAHLDALRLLGDVEVCAVVSRGGASADALAKAYGIPESGSDRQSLLRRSRPEACIVAVSHGETLECAHEVFEAGLHALVEKPVSLEPASVRELDRAAQARGVVAMVAMNRRFYETVTSALAMTRFYGPLDSVSITAPDPVVVRRATARYDSAVYDNWTAMNTIHLLDLARLFGGEVQGVEGVSRVRGPWQDTSSAAVVQFQNGTIGSYHASTAAGTPWGLTLYCGDLQVVLSPLEACSVRVGTRVWRAALAGNGGEKPGLRQQLRAFVDSVRAGRLMGLASGLEDHARSVEFALRIQTLPRAGVSTRPT